MRAKSMLAMFFCTAMTFPAGAAQDTISGSIWAPNGDCFITKLTFKPDHEVTVEFDNGDEDDGTYSLEGKSLLIQFSDYFDAFVGLYTGGRIEATHSWIPTSEDMVLEESCIFRRNTI